MIGRPREALFTALARSRFRSRFTLGAPEQAQLARHGLAGIRIHAARFVAERLAAAEPANDGRQTPMRHHPVFVAQHATATCCRRCLAKWHAIPAGRPLSQAEQAYVCDVLMDWLAIRHDPTHAPARPASPQRELF